MEVAFSGKLTLLGALSFRSSLWKKIGRSWWPMERKMEKLHGILGRRGHLLLSNTEITISIITGKKTLVCCSVISNIVRINTIVDGCPRPLASVQLACDVWEFQLCLTFPKACGFVL